MATKESTLVQRAGGGQPKLQRPGIPWNHKIEERKAKGDKNKQTAR